jgi:SAM-dependent methyltransferase
LLDHHTALIERELVRRNEVSVPGNSLLSRFWEEQRTVLKNAGTVLDLGGGTPFSGPVKQGFIAHESLYVSVDYSFAFCPHVVGDVLLVPIRDSVADVVISSAVLEHIVSPQQAVDEMYRVLKPGGCVLGYVPFMYPYHSSPSDYYRFTHQGIKYLFREFSEIDIVPWGNYSTALIGFMSGFNLKMIRIFSSLGNILGKAATSVVQGVNPNGKQFMVSYSHSPPGYYFRAKKE